MNLFSKTDSRIYSLLSIGQRGAGKTVFLAGTYSELKRKHRKGNDQSWCLNCEDSDTQEDIENVLKHINRTGEYPPATLKISNFDFSLKHRNFWGMQTLCHFRWWDTPGESCQVYNPAFLMMVLNSDGVCLFIDATKLAQESQDSEKIEEILKPIRSIAEVIYRNELKHPLALILTKCDLLEENFQNSRQIEKNLQPLKKVLESLDVNYKTFQSKVSIDSQDGVSTLKSSESTDAVVWLLGELQKAHQPAFNSNPLKLVTHPLPL